MEISNITATDLQDEIIGSIIIEDYRKEASKTMKNDKYMDFSAAGYTISILQDFESYLRKEVDLVEDDIRLVLDEYSSNFIYDELPPGIYTSKDPSEFLLRNLQSDYEKESLTRLILKLLTLA